MNLKKSVAGLQIKIQSLKKTNQGFQELQRHPSSSNSLWVTNPIYIQSTIYLTTHHPHRLITLETSSSPFLGARMNPRKKKDLVHVSHSQEFVTLLQTNRSLSLSGSTFHLHIPSHPNLNLISPVLKLMDFDEFYRSGQISILNFRSIYSSASWWIQIYHPQTTRFREWGDTVHLLNHLSPCSSRHSFLES